MANKKSKKMEKILSLIVAIVFLSCSQNSKTEEDAKDSTSISVNEQLIDPISNLSIDTIGFFMIKHFSDEKEYKLNIPFIDSAAMTKWTDLYMPKGFVDLRLYSAFLLKEYKRNNNVDIKILYTAADDWSKLHMITCTVDSTLISYQEIGENIDHLIESTDSIERYVEIDSRLIKMTDSTFKIQRIDRIYTDNYFDDLKDTVIINVVDTIVLIDKYGHIQKTL